VTISDSDITPVALAALLAAAIELKHALGEQRLEVLAKVVDEAKQLCRVVHVEHFVCIWGGNFAASRAL